MNNDDRATITLEDSALILALSERGVRHLQTVTTTTLAPSLSPEALFAALVHHPAPRFREALIALFLRQPAYAGWVPELAASLEPSAAEVLRHMYTVAAYLQRLWRGSLQIYLGDQPLLPDYFGQSHFGLPMPDEQFGEAGLRALAEQFQEATGDNWLSTYESSIALFLEQVRSEWRATR